MYKASQRGFTLIELVVVIVILGILAAFAVPRFMGLETQARVAAVKSMGGTLRSAAAMAHGVCMAQNCPNASTGITINGQAITFVNQYPNNATIGLLLESVDGFTSIITTNRFDKTGARTGNCWVRYNAPGAGAAPTIQYQAGVSIATNEAAIDTALRAAC